MDFLGDRRFLYAIAAVIVVVILAAQPTDSASCSSDDECAGRYADSSVNNSAKAVEPANRSG
jgi:hypothetical protein